MIFTVLPRLLRCLRNCLKKNKIHEGEALKGRGRLSSSSITSVHLPMPPEGQWGLVGCQEDRAELCAPTPHWDTAVGLHQGSASPWLPVQGWSLPASPGELTAARGWSHWCRRSFPPAAVTPVSGHMLITNLPDVMTHAFSFIPSDHYWLLLSMLLTSNYALEEIKNSLERQTFIANCSKHASFNLRLLI